MSFQKMSFQNISVLRRENMPPPWDLPAMPLQAQSPPRTPPHNTRGEIFIFSDKYPCTTLEVLSLSLSSPQHTRFYRFSDKISCNFPTTLKVLSFYLYLYCPHKTQGFIFFWQNILSFLFSSAQASADWSSQADDPAFDLSSVIKYQALGSF